METNEQKEKGKEVTIHVLSANGDDTYSLLPVDAVKFLKQIQSEQGKWVFKNGDLVNADKLTEDDLTEDCDLMVTSLLGGGEGVVEEGYNIVTSFTDVPNYDITIDVVEQKIIANIDKDSAEVILRNEYAIIQRLEKFLESIALKEISKVAHAVGAMDIEDSLVINEPGAGLVATTITGGTNPGLTLAYYSETDKVVVGFNEAKKFNILHARRYIIKGIEKQLNAFRDEHIQAIRTAVDM